MSLFVTGSSSSEPTLVLPAGSVKVGSQVRAAHVTTAPIPAAGLVSGFYVKLFIDSVVLKPLSVRFSKGARRSSPWSGGRAHWLNKETLTWIEICGDHTVLDSGLLAVQVPADIFNHPGFNPSGGDGGLSAVLEVRKSVCDT